jgi:hypothetical protein
LAAVAVNGRIIRWCNEERLYSALAFLRPVDYYWGSLGELHEARRRIPAAVRHRRREKSLRLRQPTLPFESTESVA